MVCILCQLSKGCRHGLNLVCDENYSISILVYILRQVHIILGLYKRCSSSKTSDIVALLHSWSWKQRRMFTNSEAVVNISLPGTFAKGYW